MLLFSDCQTRCISSSPFKALQLAPFQALPEVFCNLIALWEVIASSLCSSFGLLEVIFISIVSIALHFANIPFYNQNYLDIAFSVRVMVREIIIIISVIALNIRGLSCLSQIFSNSLLYHIAVFIVLCFYGFRSLSCM